jgi:hypothetical protein
LFIGLAAFYFNGKGKRGAFSELRFDPYIAVHHFNNAFGDSKPESCPAEFTGRAAVGLIE